jgi:predicted transcriptional regulator
MTLYRDKLLMVARLLDAVNRNPTSAITRQFSFANLNHEKLNSFAFLEQKGFLRKVPFGRTRFNYHITNQGLDLLRQINRCYEAIEDKPTIGVMQFA